MNQFRIDTERFRQSKVYQNFLTKFEFIISLTSNNSKFSSMFRVQFSVFRLDILIRFEVFTIQSEVFTSSRFWRNSNLEIRDFIFSSLIFNYSSIINFDFDSNIFRQFIVESNITSNERRSISIQIDNSQTLSFIQIEKIRRIMLSIQSSFKVDQTFWNDIMIVIIVFVSISRFASETFFFCWQ